MSVPDKFSNICRLIQDNFPVITLKEFYDSKERFEKYVTREVISLYYLFFILKELRNLPFSLPTIKKTKVEGAKKSKH